MALIVKYSGVQLISVCWLAYCTEHCLYIAQITVALQRFFIWIPAVLNMQLQAEEFQCPRAPIEQLINDVCKSVNCIGEAVTRPIILSRARGAGSPSIRQTSKPWQDTVREPFSPHKGGHVYGLINYQNENRSYFN